jgi:rhodanese-related sulfurtransferase
VTPRFSLNPSRTPRTARRTAAVLAAAAALAIVSGACSGSAATHAPTAATGAPAAATPAASSPAAAAPAALPAEIDVAEAVRLQDAGAFMLDVRETDEWAAGHIKGATLIPLGELASRAAEVPADRQVVVVCRSGNRSAQGRDILLDAGLPSVTSMGGGMKAWTSAGQPVVTGP